MKSNCPVCEQKTLEPVRRAGRFIRHRKLEVKVPADFEIPECANCGARPISYKLAKALDPLLEAEYGRQLSAMISSDLEELARVKPLYLWEKELGLSKGYLSKVREVAAPGVQLVALVRLLANNPSRLAELEALFERRPVSTRVSSSERQRYGLRVAPPPPLVKMSPIDVSELFERTAA